MTTTTPPSSTLEDVQPVTAGEAIGLLFDGVRLAFGDPTVRKPFFAALGLNALLFAAIFGGLIWTAFHYTEALVTPDPDVWFPWMWTFVGWMLRTLALVTSAVVAPVLFKLLASIVLPLFNGAVFEAARVASGGPDFPEEQRGLPAAQVISIEVRRVIRFIILLLAILIGGLVLGFVPVVNLVTTPLAVVLQFLLGAATLGWDLHSFHFELHQMNYGAQRAYLKAKRGRVLGVGAVAVLLVMIPIVQILFISTNVAGAGMMSARLDGASDADSV